MPFSIRILFVEDSTDDVELVALELSRHGCVPEIKQVETATELQKALAEEEWDIVLSDYNLPQFSAPAALNVLRQHDPDLPFIVLSGTMGEDAAVYAMREGVNDYLTKNNLARLVPAIQREMRDAKIRQNVRRADHVARRLAAIVESSDDAIIGLDLSGVVMDWNPGAERLYGWSAHEAIGRHISFIAPEEHHGEQKALLETVCLGEAIQSFETVRVRKGGQPVSVSLTESPIRDASGRMIGASIIVRDITMRKEMERKLQESEEQLRLALEATQVGQWEFDLRTGVVRRSLRHDRIYGFEELTLDWSYDRFLHKHVHPDDRQEVDARFRASVANRTDLEFECRIFRVDGEERFIWVKGGFSPNGNGTAPKFSGLIMDISERKRTENDYRQQTKLLQSILDSIGDGVIVADERGNLQLLNKAGEEMLRCGLPNSDFSKNPEVFRMFLPDGVTLFPAENLPLARAIRGENVDQLEIVIKPLQNSHPIWISATARPIRDDKGRVCGGVSIFRDFTAKKLAALELQLRDRAIHAVTQGIVIADHRQPDNPIIFASPGFERMTGYAQEEILGRNCRFLQGIDTKAESIAQIREAIRKEEPCTVELLNYRKDGTPFWNELSISPIRDESGKVTHFGGVQTDVTERRRLEEQYHQSQKMEAVGLLAGGVAHDFNNLLCVINGYSQMLFEKLHAENPDRELLGEIYRAGERAASLTRQLLVFSRRQVVAQTELDVNVVVVEAEKMLGRLIGEDVSLQTSLAERLGMVLADEGQLQQVLMNLAVNARDAMPRGGTLTIQTRNIQITSDDVVNGTGVVPGNYVLLAVSDTGCGMTDEVKSRLFEPFFTTKAPGKGTGLGMAVVHGIVKQANGYIEVESELGVGTSFNIYLPRVDDAQRMNKSRSSAERVPPRGTETILMVEDDDGVRALTRYFLTDFGYNVLEASNGAEALAIAAKYPAQVDLLLTDVVMPGMSGREVAEGLAAVGCPAKVLFVSGYPDDAVLTRGISRDEVQFLAKPFTPITLAVKIREVLKPVAPNVF